MSEETTTEEIKSSDTLWEDDFHKLLMKCQVAMKDVVTSFNTASVTLFELQKHSEPRVSRMLQNQLSDLGTCIVFLNLLKQWQGDYNDCFITPKPVPGGKLRNSSSKEKSNLILVKR